MIFFSLATSFILGPSGSEEEGVAPEASRGVDEDEEVAEAVGRGAGARRSWREPSGGTDNGSGGRWGREEEVGSSMEDGGGVGPSDGGGEDEEEEEETLFSLLSLPSVSVTPARGCEVTLVW